MNKPLCGKCGQAMTPGDSRVHPELFLHDACLPEELKTKVTEKLSEYSNPYQEVIDKLRAEKWSQRQDSARDQLRDIIPIIYAMGCYDAGELIQKYIERTGTASD
jgi:hypothetical protein